jgi:hypothetical protein
MNKNKWLEIYDEEMESMLKDYSGALFITPETWPSSKNILLKFIKDVDDATEAYNMENKGNK